jgi:hypothetical protein
MTVPGEDNIDLNAMVRLGGIIATGHDDAVHHGRP